MRKLTGKELEDHMKAQAALREAPAKKTVAKKVAAKAAEPVEEPAAEKADESEED
jgi:hypothetical protein